VFSIAGAAGRRFTSAAELLLCGEIFATAWSAVALSTVAVAWDCDGNAK
jgi:hypothetical protein